MSGSAADVPDPTTAVVAGIRRAWRTLKAVYYANSPAWRVLKAGALAFLGFSLWAGSNLLLSYRPEWTLLYYPMAYGFVLVAYGPVHHLAVVPVALRLRRRGTGRTARAARHLPNAGLAAFLAAVVVLGTVPVGAMTFDFRSPGVAGADVDPALLCTAAESPNGTAVHCHLADAGGVDSLVVESGGRRLRTVEEPPFSFTVHESELATVVGREQFQVVLRDESGRTLRRYTRTLSMVSS